MVATDCNSIEQAVSDHLSAHISAHQLHGACVITIPFMTLDKRWVDVFIEPRHVDFFLIHDGGKAVNELILQGIKITPSIEKDFASLANRFGVTYGDEMFQTGAKIAHLPVNACAVGMCSALAMMPLLEHEPMTEEQTLESRIGTALRRWGRNRAKIQENEHLQGKVKQHVFDFVIHPQRKQPVTVSVLNPTTAGSLSAAERFGFKAQDLTETRYGKWKRIAVEAKAETWSRDARKIVETFAHEVIEIQTGDEGNLSVVGNALDRLIA